jgi:hypothetical protein
VAGAVESTTVSATGNITAGNVAGTTGAFTTVTGNANATSLTSGTVPSARLSGSYTINISGAATTAGTVTTAAQPNITSVGTLTSLSVSGNVTGGNVSTAGLITATGNITGGNLRTTGVTITTNTVSATGNVNGGNLVTAGLVSATGTVTGSSFVGSGANLTGVVGWTTQANTAPASPRAGDFWYNSFTGIKYQYTATGTSNVWVDQSDPTVFQSITTGQIINANANGVGNIGTAAASFNTIFARATQAQYADLAEMYCADADYAPGTVLVFGGTHEVTISNTDSDRRIAGVVSTNTSYIINKEALFFLDFFKIKLLQK